MKYLLSTTEVYRVSSEEEATKLIEDAKNDSGYLLDKYSSQYKEKKQKGEVVDYYWKVSLTKKFTDEKEPELETQVKYTSGAESAF